MSTYDEYYNDFVSLAQELVDGLKTRSKEENNEYFKKFVDKGGWRRLGCGAASNEYIEKFKEIYENTPNFLSYFTIIPYGAFANCSWLISITIPNSIIEIDSEAFFSCTELTEVFLPYSVKVLGSGIFKYCKSLSKIILPKYVNFRHIPAYFAHNTALKEAWIPATVKSVGSCAFPNTLDTLVVSKRNTPLYCEENSSIIKCKKIVYLGPVEDFLIFCARKGESDGTYAKYRRAWSGHTLDQKDHKYDLYYMIGSTKYKIGFDIDNSTKIECKGSAPMLGGVFTFGTYASSWGIGYSNNYALMNISRVKRYLKTFYK